MVLRKARQIVALLLICMAVGAVIACQVYTTPLDQGQAMPSQSDANSSAHSLLAFSCMGMAAVLSTLVIFAWFLFHVLYTTPLVLNPAVLVFPPCIPPRNITCA